jgi:cobaltochelatase CobN
MRKGYWRPDAQTRREIAEEYVRSVVRHGEGGGLRGGGNEKLRAFVEEALASPPRDELKELLAQWKRRRDAAGHGPGPGPAAAPTTARRAAAQAQGTPRRPTKVPGPPKQPSANGPREKVAGKVLEPLPESPQSSGTPQKLPAERPVPWSLLAAIGGLLLVAAGYGLRWGIARR